MNTVNTVNTVVFFPVETMKKINKYIFYKLHSYNHAKYKSSNSDSTSTGQVPTQKAAMKAHVIMGVPGQETYPTIMMNRNQHRARRCNRKFS